jgi:glycosyltransferase involved in cell wall biosynthesis
MKVGIIGTRGIPNTYGGFERFVETLVDNPEWASTEVSFVVYGETPSRAYNSWTSLVDVGLKKNSRPFAYYFRSVLAATRECDVVLCCGVPLSIFSYWPAMRSKSLIMNPDGCEWRRTKWSTLGRLALRMLYFPAIAGAQRIVLDAQALRQDFAQGEKAVYIPYVAPEPCVRELSAAVSVRFTLNRPYALVVARLEPENNIEIAIDAFELLDDCDAELIIIGSHTTKYYRDQLRSRATSRIRFIGGIYDQNDLNELRSNCLAYWHGHSVGGTNPSLLEALATVRGALFCHDNIYNQEVAGTEAQYFSGPGPLAGEIRRLLTKPLPTFVREPSRDIRFHPQTIFQAYLSLFLECGRRGVN